MPGDQVVIRAAQGAIDLEFGIGEDPGQGLDQGGADLAVDLSQWAGKSVKVELSNQANGWSWEAAYWAKVDVSTD